MKYRSTKNGTAQFAQSSKPNFVLEEGYVPEQCDMVTPLTWMLQVMGIKDPGMSISCGVFFMTGGHMITFYVQDILIIL